MQTWCSCVAQIHRRWPGQAIRRWVLSSSALQSSTNSWSFEHAPGHQGTLRCQPSGLTCWCTCSGGAMMSFAWRLLRRKSCLRCWGERLGERSPLQWSSPPWVSRPHQPGTILVWRILPARLFVEGKRAVPGQLGNSCRAWRRYHSALWCCRRGLWE